MIGLIGKIDRVSKQVLELLDDGVMIFDKDFNLTFINNKAESIFGYQAKDVLGQHLNTFIPARFHMQHNVFTNEFSKSDKQSKTMSERTRKIYGLHMNGHEFLTNISIMKTNTSGINFVAIIRNNNISIGNDKELLRIAATDPLTGVLNKNEFLSQAEKESLRAKRYSRPFSVALLKFENYENIVEKHQYDVTDKALQWMANICCNTLRNVDIFGRWSDSEFSMLLPETGNEGAEIISRRLVKIVNDNRFEWKNHNLQLKICIGIAEYDERKTSLEESMRYAAEALNRAKSEDNNQVIVYKQK